MALKFSDFFLAEKSNIIYDLGCSTGSFLKALSNKKKIKKHFYYGIDEIKEMCLLAKKKIKNNKKC